MDTNITLRLEEILEASSTAPFLFIGSGFSRRYLGLEDWKGLMRRFSNNLPNPYDKYLSESNADVPTSARLISKDFSDYWWKLEKSREICQLPNWRHHITSPLRYEICEYLSNISVNDAIERSTELSVLADKKTVIDGVITTNWDCLLESIFPDFKVFIGQGSLLFSNPQSIAELYKIHGCCKDVNSLILTDDDYQDFERKNAYLSAKLLSVFLEHPIIFIGYSFHDPNIELILKSISEMMDTNELVQKLGNNLIFLSRANGASDSVSQTFHTFNSGTKIPITRVITDDFSKVYKALQKRERLIPANVLRIFKEQLYSIVQSTEPQKKVAVMNIEDIVSGDSDIQFVAGIGVADKQYGDKGISGIKAKDIFRDAIFDDMVFDRLKVLKECIPEISKSMTYLPISKFYVLDPTWMPITKSESTKNIFTADLNFWKNKINSSYQKKYAKRKVDLKGFDAVVNDKSLSDPYILNYLALALIADSSIAESVNNYLKEKFDILWGTKLDTDLKKLICVYDFVVHRS